MSSINKKSYTLLALLVLTIAAGYIVARLSNIEDPLLPSEKSAYPWHPHAVTDMAQGGTSYVDLREHTYNLDFDFKLGSEHQYPFATLGITFNDETDPDRLLNWSKYSSIRLQVKCRPNDTLGFVLYTFEEGVTNTSEITSYRTTLNHFNCSNEWQELQLNLHKFDTPEWWLKRYNLDLSSQKYSLEKVRGFSIASSHQSRIGELTNVTIRELTLIGRNLKLIYTSAALACLLWGGLLLWYFQEILAKKEEETQTETETPEAPAMSYQPVEANSKQEREKSAVLEYLATEYTNPDLSVESTVSTLGLNRAKINDILREETGLTFSAYLNKLRLTEAARLLSDKNMGVSETAYAVGYRSVSYFNRVFKKEYDCTPSSYKAPDSANSAPPPEQSA